MSALLDRVAGAPITWGVCEVPDWGVQLDAERVLREIEQIGLRATELGPEGFLPVDAERLRGLLSAHGLRLVGGFVPVVLHEGSVLDEQLARVRVSADLLTAGGADVLVLAASTDDHGYEGSAELDDDAWRALVNGIDRVIELGAEHGLTVALHPHVGTVIERPQHIERLLETSATSLCLDTGHLVVGGADPVEIARAARQRVAHVHLKDVSADLADQVRKGDLGYREAVRRGMYRPLGAGDLDIRGFVREVERAGYRGWYVLEQDTVLEARPGRDAGPIRDAAASLAYLDRAVKEVNARATG
jgi:inosose dehydratase